MRTFPIIIALCLLPALAVTETVQYQEEQIYTEEVAPVAARATLLPEISVIGNFVGRSASRDIDERDRNYLALQEAEVVFQSRIYPNVRADFVIALEDMEDHAAFLEEGYVTIMQLGELPLAGRLGRLRTPFGKVNPIHPHHRPYVDQPAVITAFLGDHGLIGQGVSAQYLLPTRLMFANLEVGYWKAASHSHDHCNHNDHLHNDHNGHHHDHHDHHDDHAHHAHGVGVIDDTFATARLWTSFAPTELSEFELGLSGARGDAPIIHDEHGRVSLLGADITYRRWPTAFSRDMIRAEWISHRSRFEGDRHARSGYYLLAARQPSQYWEYGIRLDNTRFPFPIDGRRNATVGFITHRLTESTYLRLQGERGRITDVGSYNAAYFQMVFGMGPHSHPLE